MSDEAPLCRKRSCESRADVAVISRPNARSRPVAFCDDHCPEPSYDRDVIVIRRWGDRDVEPARVIGQRNGEVMHLEHPDGGGSVCSRIESSSHRYDLTRGYPGETRLCGRCLQSISWAKDVDDETVRRWVRAVREIGKRFGDMHSEPIEPWYQYPELNPRESHQIAEGVERGEIA